MKLSGEAQISTNLLTNFITAYNECDKVKVRDLNEDIPVVDLAFLLPPGFIGTNEAFNTRTRTMIESSLFPCAIFTHSTLLTIGL